MLIVTDFALLFAKLIARTAKDIDYLIDHLPNEESSMDLQVYKSIYLLILCLCLHMLYPYVSIVLARYNIYLLFHYNLLLSIIMFLLIAALIS